MSEFISIHFSSGSHTALNICLAVIMFGIAFDIKVEHFTQLLNQKQSAFTGFLSLFVLLPLCMVIFMSVIPTSNVIALGMLMVAAFQKVRHLISGLVFSVVMRKQSLAAIIQS